MEAGEGFGVPLYVETPSTYMMHHSMNMDSSEKVQQSVPVETYLCEVVRKDIELDYVDDQRSIMFYSRRVATTACDKASMIVDGGVYHFWSSMLYDR